MRKDLKGAGTREFGDETLMQPLSSQAVFEVISSEHSYLRSLQVLIHIFKNCADLSDTMTKTENHHLFSNITDVCEASKK